MLSLAQPFTTVFFSHTKDYLVHKVLTKLSSYKQEKEAFADMTSSFPSQLNCSCCNWKGMRSEAKKEYLLLPEAVGLEILCPDCNSYMDFVYHKNEN